MRGWLSQKRCEEIKALVVEMFDECGVHSYPIDPFEIARTLCYIVRPYSGLSAAEQEAAFEESDEGYSKLEFFPDLGFRYVIYYNDMVLSEGRIRWTLFHEIAHCYLGHHEHPDNSLYIIEEQEANLFTKNAIAPPVLISKLQCDCPSAVAHVFDTSLQAADYVYDYYLKWLRYGAPVYTDFEVQLLRMFGFAA